MMSPCDNGAINILRPRRNGRHFPDDIFKWIFLNENVWISINVSLKFVPRGPINNIPTFVEVTAWRRPGDKPLSEPMVVRLPTHICVTRPQWVKAGLMLYLWYQLKQGIEEAVNWRGIWSVMTRMRRHCSKLNGVINIYHHHSGNRMSPNVTNQNPMTAVKASLKNRET